MATAQVDAASEQAVREMLFAAAQAVERDADDIAGDIADVLMREVPEISADAETREDILLRGRAGLLSWARAFLRGVAPDEVESPAEAYAYARALARRGVPLDVLLRIHRLALAVLLQAWEARLDPGDSAELLLAATRRSIEVNFQFHDALMEGLSAEYQRERERWVRGAEAMRRETINAILAETPVDTDGAGRILGYDLRRHHIGLVLWAVPTPDDPQVLPRLERAATAASAHLEAGRPLMLSVDGSTIWAWLGRDSELPRELIDSLAAAPNADGVSIALGAPGQGLTGFRRTPPRRGRHRQGRDRQPPPARHRHRLPRRRARGAVRRRPRAHAPLRARAPRRARRRRRREPPAARDADALPRGERQPRGDGQADRRASEHGRQPHPRLPRDPRPRRRAGPGAAARGAQSRRHARPRRPQDCAGPTGALTAAGGSAQSPGRRAR